MARREPEPWETNATAPFLRIGDVGVHALGRGRFLVVTPDDKQTVDGFESARQLARDLAAVRNGSD